MNVWHLKRALDELLAKDDENGSRQIVDGELDGIKSIEIGVDRHGNPALVLDSAGVRID